MLHTTVLYLFYRDFLNLQLIIWTNPKTFCIKNKEFHNSNL